jgi:hypothetical protein
MSWTAILLVGWPLASLVSGPTIGRFVAVYLENPPQISEHSQPVLAGLVSNAEAARFGESAITPET